MTLSDVLPITIDYTPAATQTAGIGRLVREQVVALLAHDTRRHYQLVYPIGAPYPPSYQSQNVTQQTIPLSAVWQQRLWHRLQMPVPVEWLTGRFALYHATDFLLPHTRLNAPTLLTVHDLSFVRVPEAASPRLRSFLSAAVPRSVQRASHIIADSEATRHDLIDLYRCPPEKISVVLSSVSPRFKPDATRAIRAKYHLGNSPYVLCVGTVQPRKNYARVIQALAALGPTFAEVMLVIAGGKGWLEDEMYCALQATQMTHRVKLLGFVDDADLPALYSQAALTVVASLYEGFGFPVLESMACGTPVIASNISSLPEVAGDAAVLVDPYNVEAIAHAIQQVLSDDCLAQQLRQRGLAQAARFTPQATAHQLAQVYSSALGIG